MRILDKAARLLWGQHKPPQPIFDSTLRERVVIFAGQLQAWGYARAADEVLHEILDGPVEAPDYYKLQTELHSALTEIAHLRDALAASEQRERIATTTYDGQQSSYRELESLYSAMTERAQALTEALHLCRENYQDTAEGMGCSAGNWDGGSSESCEHCHLLRSTAIFDAVLKQSGVEK